MIGMAISPTPVSAGRGNAVGAGLLGFGVGAIVGSALTPREVYVVPPPPPPRRCITVPRATVHNPGVQAGIAIAVISTDRLSILAPAIF
jgi:hypothetical protein